MGSMHEAIYGNTIVLYSARAHAITNLRFARRTWKASRRQLEGATLLVWFAASLFMQKSRLLVLYYDVRALVFSALTANLLELTLVGDEIVVS